MPLLRVQVCPSLPSYGKSFGHKLGGESSRLSVGWVCVFLASQGVSVCTLGSWLCLGSPCSYHRKIDPPLFFILHVILHNFFLYFRTHLFIAPVPPFLCPDSHITAPYYFLLTGFNLLHPYPHLAFLLLRQPQPYMPVSLLWSSWYRWPCKSPHPKAPL